ncbi:MAG: hypothetical protein E5Y79_31565 [Mesorhizobium sp.]|uniref:DNA N-6-adenine-methyltransferase n=1 Tax=Mesorhizobium sp. TaxID=1871066 RepID=UPI00120FD8EC|nr:DNA N-6-adenine-methyltransferase [Mesorhizobium sp.]TIL56057.1 MAG: hypothetical protein E5Y79_31565 [Mesorhizobium sp.]
MSAEWVTPKAYIYLARMVMGDIDLDPASSEFAQLNVGARTYYTPERDGLSQPWFGRVWLSPPNGRRGAPDFTGKLIDEFCSGRVEEAIVLTPNATDTVWHHRLAGLRHPACFKRGRVRFESPDRASSMPANGQTFFYLGERQQRFKEVFSQIGHVWRAVTDAKTMAEICEADRRAAQIGRAARAA